MKKLACALFIVILAVAFAPAASARPEEKGGEAALTNTDVVKLCKIGLGDNVVIAKIKEAPKVDFKTGTDDIIKLKGDGCSSAVIEAVINRSGGSSPPPASGGSSSDTRVNVKLVATTGETQLSVKRGSHEQVMVFGIHNFCVFKEFTADTRTNDRKVSILVAAEEGPEGHFWLTKVEQDDDDKDRSLPLVSAGPWGGRVADEPDEDAIVDCEVKQEKPGLWRMTPKKDLKPGEYGVYFVGSTLYDFGVDK